MPIVAADASQLEWRVILELSRDEVGMQEVLNKLDTHSLNQEAFNLPERVIAKIYLFRTIYRGSGWAFAHDPKYMHVSDKAEFWDNINEQFYKKYSGIDRIHRVWADQVVRGHDLVGPSGRHWHIPIKRDRRGEIQIPWTVLSNYPVQGTAADVIQLARISFARRLWERGWPVIMISTVHDSIVVDAPPEWVQAVVDLFHQVFDDLIANIKRVWKYDWVVPLDCECKYGPNMKDMQKIARSA